MIKLLLTICLVTTLGGTSLNGFANTSIFEAQDSDSHKQTEGYNFLAIVDIYVQDYDNGGFKQDGIINLYKDSEGNYFVKSNNKDSEYIPVFTTIHKYSKEFKYSFMNYNQFLFN